MIIEKITGIENNDGIISEKCFNEYGIVETSVALKNYFSSYGYEFAGIYDLSDDYIIVQNKNSEIEAMLKDYNIFDVINYKTGETHITKLSNDRIKECRKMIPDYIFNSSLQIVFKDGLYRLVSTNDTKIIVEAEYMQFIENDLIVYQKHGIYYILDTIKNETFPIVKKEFNIYYGHSPNNFIDMRKAMFFQTEKTFTPVSIETCDLEALIKNFPYGQKRGKTFKLLSNPIHYGISMNNQVESNEIWYQSLSSRDEMFDSLYNKIGDILILEKQKQLKRSNE